VNRSFERADVVLTAIASGPPPLVADVVDHGLMRSLYHANAAAWAVPWNVIGQPAASVPVGADPDGLPLAVQLGGRPSDEVTLLRLAAQIEAAQPARP
jgi:amidase